MLKATLMDKDGAFVWDNSVQTIGPETSTKYDVQISSCIDDQWILFWEDCRVDGGVSDGIIFGQNLRVDGSMGSGAANESLSRTIPGLSITPNPVEDQARITYTSQSNGRIEAEISLLRLDGAKVASLYNGSLQPGQNTIEWNRPANLPAGLYIVQMATNQGNAFCKIILK